MDLHSLFYLHSGRVVNHRRAGGNKVRYRMVDLHRVGPEEGPPLEEKVNESFNVEIHTKQI